MGVFKQTTLLLFCISMTSELLLALCNWFFVLELVTFEIIQECTLKILSWFSQENFIFNLLSLYLPRHWENSVHASCQLPSPKLIFIHSNFMIEGHLIY